MTQPAGIPDVTYEEYLAAEAQSDTKHEYARGEVIAMAGGTIEHDALAASMLLAIGNALRGKPCRVLTSDVRVRSSGTGFAAYPDLSVVCGKLLRDASDPDAVANPVVIVEVLSDSTELRDRTVKFAHYRHISTLQEYVLVSQHEPRIEMFRRNDAGRWELYEAAAGQKLELASVGCTIDVDEVYRDPLAAEAG